MAKKRRKSEDRHDDAVLQIDEYNLEVEWAKQASLYHRYAHEAALARQDADEAKAELDVVKAELDLDIRDDPDKYNLERVTEAAISNVITTTDEYQSAVQRVNAAQHSMRIAEAMCRALEHKKAALTKIVDLHLASYYAEPPKPDDPDGVLEDRVTKQVRTRGRRRKASQSK